jgi:hypothetical protein
VSICLYVQQHSSMYGIQASFGFYPGLYIRIYIDLYI